MDSQSIIKALEAIEPVERTSILNHFLAAYESYDGQALYLFCCPKCKAMGSTLGGAQDNGLDFSPCDLCELEFCSKCKPLGDECCKECFEKLDEQAQKEVKDRLDQKNEWRKIQAFHVTGGRPERKEEDSQGYCAICGWSIPGPAGPEATCGKCG